MGVFIPIPISTVEQEREQPSKTYRLDLERGRIYGAIDGLEAVCQYIRKVLLTPRFRCLIYDNQYGSEIKQTIIAGDVSSDFIETDMPRIVREACLADTRVLDIFDFSFQYENDEARIKFTATTIFGDTVIEEVI